MKITTDIRCGDSREQLKSLPRDSVDLVITSPPYADQRKNVYGGIRPEEYIDWFLPVSKQLLRVLKPSGTFILNIKEKAVNGERSTYVIELILAMRKQGWLWTEEFIWHKKTAIRANGRTGSGILGSDCCSSTRIKNSTCTRKRSWCRWANGHLPG